MLFCLPICTALSSLFMVFGFFFGRLLCTLLRPWCVRCNMCNQMCCMNVMLFYASDARIWICMFMNEKLGVNRLLMRDDVPTMCESAQTIYGNASDTEHRQQQCHATAIVWELFTGGADDMLSFTCCLCSVFLPTFTHTYTHERTPFSIVRSISVLDYRWQQWLLIKTT